MTEDENSDHTNPEASEELLQIIHEKQQQDEKQALKIAMEQQEKEQEGSTVVRRSFTAITPLQRDATAAIKKKTDGKHHLVFSGTGRAYSAEATRMSRSVTSTYMLDKSDKSNDRDDNEKDTTPLTISTGLVPPPPQATELRRSRSLVSRVASAPGAFQVTPNSQELIFDEGAESSATSRDPAAAAAATTTSAEDQPVEATVNAHLVEEEDQIKDQEIERLKQELAAVRQQQQQQQSVAVAQAVVGVKTIQPFDIKNAKEDIIKVDEPKKNPANRSTKALPFDSMPLFGRDLQLQQLQQVVQDLCGGKEENGTNANNKKQLVQIGGVSGSGKSALALQLKQMMTSKKEENPNGKLLYLSGKIDASLGDPYAALGSALESFCQSLQLLSPPDTTAVAGDSAPLLTKESFRTEYHNQLDQEDLELLVPIMPSLCKVLDITTSTSASASSSLVDANSGTSFLEAKTRFQHAVKKFIQVLCSFGPVVLVMDDTQWIQQSLLDLMKDLLEADPNQVSRFLMVTTFRDDEVNPDHIYCKAVDQWKDLSNLAFTDLRTGELGQEDVLSLLSTLLSSSTASEQQELESLARCVHKKTAGHCFFVKEFMISLQSSGLLFYDENDAKAWSFDIKNISEAADATDNVVGLLSNKLHKLDATVQSMLPKLAALGSTFPSTVAQIVVHDSISGSGDPRGSTEFLLLLIREGLLVECRRGWFKWEHDKLREAAMSFAAKAAQGGGDTTQEEIRFSVGKLLLRELSQEELNISLFTVTDLLNSNAITIPSSDPLYDQLINLNLRSGQLALKTSAFNASAMYLEFGISLLPPNTKWTTHFQDTLELYSAGAEAQYSVGDHVKCKQYADEVNNAGEYGVVLLQRKRVTGVLVASYYAQKRMVEARDLMVGLLEELGCKFPKYGRSVKGPLKIISISMSVNKSTTTLSNAPPMVDEEKKWAVSLLDKLCTVTFICDPPMLPLGIAKALSWSLKYGKCESSAPVLGTVALILAGSLGDFASGKKFADVALKFMDSSTGSRTIFLCYQFALHTQIPVQECIEALGRGYVMGLRSGDLESAFWCEYSALDARLHIGDYLPGIIEEYKSFHLKLSTQENDMIEFSSLLICQVAMNLSDPDTSNHRSVVAVADEEYERRFNKKASSSSSENPDEEENDDAAQTDQHMKRYADRIGITGAFWLYDYEDAVRLINENQSWKLLYEKQFPGANGTATLYFYCALVLLFAPNVAKRKPLVMKFLNRLRLWAKKGNPNVRHYVSLIEADLASLNKKSTKVVAELYQKAISDAREAGFKNDVALATERYGDHFVRTEGLGDEAKEQYQQAIRTYEEYGALGRVTLLRKRHNLMA